MQLKTISLSYLMHKNAQTREVFLLQTLSEYGIILSKYCRRQLWINIH